MVKGASITSETAQALLEVEPVEEWSVEDAICCVRHRECGTDLREVRWFWHLVEGCAPGALVIQAGVGAGSLSFVLMVACHQAALTLWDIDIFCSDYRFEDLDPVITGDELNVYNPGFNELCGRDEYLEIIRAAGPGPRGHVMTTIGEAQRTLAKLRPERVGFCFLDAGKRNYEQFYEWRSVAPHVESGGIVALHDSTEGGDPQKSIDEFRRSCLDFPELGEWEEMQCPYEPDSGEGVPWRTGWRTRAWRKQ